jgi:Tol biopolymer transport system component
MAILPGRRLGPYEILSSIGAGGMGEVYRAHDTKLGRDVAIKVLPANFVNDPERLSRFQREARMLAALNHANIATIYGLEQCDGVTCLVMELVSGETLAERMKAGPFGIEEALKIAVQIAEALEAAHEKSIIHRDLKPANVKVTPEGKVKVLDFGLAKAFAGDAASEDIGNSPTLSMAATMQGVILGTAAYMSPEQARGKSVDKRTDIWAFGCVLYELLTGKQAFHGEDVTDILAAVVRAEPDWTALPAKIPSTIRTLLRRCLRKDKRQRISGATDVRIEIEDAIAAPATAEPAAAAIGAGVLGRRALLLAAGCLVAACVVTGVAIWNLKPTPSKPVTRTVITLPADQRLAIAENPAVAISPDGRLLAYVAVQGSVQQLYLRAMDSLEAGAIPGTGGAINPFFSPDSQSLGFFAEGKLKKVSVNGGGATILGDASSGRGASWGSQGAIVFIPSLGASVQELREAGGTPRPLTHIDKGEFTVWPELLPDGKAVLFASGNAGPSMRIAVHVTGTGEQRILVPVPGSTQPRYATSGHLLYVQGSTLMAAPFDARRQALTGEAVPVVENVPVNPTTAAAQYSISATGSLVYVSGGSQANQSKLLWVSRDGKEQPLAAPPRAYLRPRISPDGRKVAVEQDNQVWVYELARDTMTRFTFEGSTNNFPVWTPDGSRIAFTSDKDGPRSVFWQKADGSGGLEKLTSSEYARFPLSWSADGQLLSFLEVNPTTGVDIWVLDMKERKAVTFLRTPFHEIGWFSPDGRWMAYMSNESGRYEVYLQPYPGPGGKWQISTDGGMDARWNANGRELTYRNGDKMMAVDITTQPAFSAGKPKMLFEGPYIPPSPTFSYYDVSADGQRFLMLKPVQQAQATTQIVVVQNWFEELKQKVPTGKK